ncbi:hypothetical protein AAVH_10294, partial [Aphelenchoides avenae]
MDRSPRCFSELVKKFAPCHDKIWIGLGAPHRPAHWTWLDMRTPWTFNNFVARRGAYNAKLWNPDKYCAFMQLKGPNAGKWTDGPCTGQKSVLSTVCQFPVV